MGFHLCEYATGEQAQAAWAKAGIEGDAPFASSGDVTIGFKSGNQWVMPDMLPLYVALGWTPPRAFVDDVMGSDVESGGRRQTRSVGSKPTPVGYLRTKADQSGTPASDVVPSLPGTMDESIPEGFMVKLASAMKVASLTGGHSQTKSLGFDTRPGYRLM